ncbi:nitroreductase family protein [Propionispora vibrioides]|jgi:nitroreductase|uniref:Nitroreductase n=1 Tax=Propionispora vibrioides TaxID=112903 RepID=A0A1H8PRQ1_9FIRM|nr:nitroreductase family protein [Propionispora vibrioides]SEO44223.1 Nitroreductase [Propionispora vibrioides]
MDFIFRRRSIRRYTKQAVNEEQIHLLLQAAMNAPSADNQQLWQFIVINDRERLRQIPVEEPYSQIFTEAPMAILVCGDQRLERLPGTWVQDCSAAVENILLAATGLGLGSVWLNVHPHAERINAFQQFFRLPPEVMPLAILPIGYPLEGKEPVHRFVASRVHYNQW